jgi:hypothetical protein
MAIKLPVGLISIAAKDIFANNFLVHRRVKMGNTRRFLLKFYIPEHSWLKYFEADHRNVIDVGWASLFALQKHLEFV